MYVIELDVEPNRCYLSENVDCYGRTFVLSQAKKFISHESATEHIKRVAANMPDFTCFVSPYYERR
jgi:hypothetical protein